jgi:hypothetical protein
MTGTPSKHICLEPHDRSLDDNSQMMMVIKSGWRNDQGIRDGEGGSKAGGEERHCPVAILSKYLVIVALVAFDDSRT